MMLIHTFTLVRSFDRWQQITALQVHCDQHWYDFFCIPGDVSVPQKYVKVRFRFVKGLFVWLQAITFFQIWLYLLYDLIQKISAESIIRVSHPSIHPSIICTHLSFAVEGSWSQSKQTLSDWRGMPVSCPDRQIPFKIKHQIGSLALDPNH